MFLASLLITVKKTENHPGVFQQGMIRKLLGTSMTRNTTQQLKKYKLLLLGATWMNITAQKANAKRSHTMLKCYI